jgi:MYXO-CTERM domain-containing protein
MKRKNLWFLPVSVALAASFAAPHDASACGGCFVQQSESTQVSGHRMILSVYPEATSLWDQITYTGAPESFAWVLPIKGTVEVGLSSDALFQVLEQTTQVVVSSPSISCPNSCNFNGTGGSGGGGVTGTGSGGGVTVLEQEVVGPYETVQLSAADPAALTDWLTSHGYNIPPDIQPVVDAYVAEEFNFLALKLVPGQGVDSMRPVRITTPGANPTLPLRMVAAGTGAVTPIILWVVSDGRYDPTNFPTFTVSADELTWDWDAASSDYAEVRQSKFEALDGFGWLIERAGGMTTYDVTFPIQYGGGLDSYADADGMNAQENFDADVAALFDGLMPDYVTQTYVTRMTGQLSRPALASDLQLGAPMDQSTVSNYLVVDNTVGTPPACPPDPCADEGGSGGGGSDGSGGSGGGCNTGGGCSTGGGPLDAGSAAIALGIAGLLGARRRRRRARSV